MCLGVLSVFPIFRQHSVDECCGNHDGQCEDIGTSEKTSSFSGQQPLVQAQLDQEALLGRCAEINGRLERREIDGMEYLAALATIGRRLHGQ